MSNRRLRRRRVVYVGQELTERRSRRELEGIARRQLVATTGKCPCGATLRAPKRAFRPGAITIVTVEHQPGCPAVRVAPSTRLMPPASPNPKENP